MSEHPLRRGAAALCAAIAAAAIPSHQGRSQEARAVTAPADRIADVLARAHPTPREQAWRRIPWRESLTAALAEARRDRKPVFAFLSDGWFPTGSC